MVRSGQHCHCGARDRLRQHVRERTRVLARAREAVWKDLHHAGSRSHQGGAMADYVRGRQIRAHAHHRVQQGCQRAGAEQVPALPDLAGVSSVADHEERGGGLSYEPMGSDNKGCKRRREGEPGESAKMVGAGGSVPVVVCDRTNKMTFMALSMPVVRENDKQLVSQATAGAG